MLLILTAILMAAGPPHLQLRELFHMARTTVAVEMSIIVSAYNARKALDVSMPLLFAHTVGSCELLVLLDATVDDSLDVVVKHATHAFNTSVFTQVVVYKGEHALWEAAGETALMRLSKASRFFISVQPDQLIHEKDWNVRLALPAERFRDVFAVSARCAHALHGGNAIGRCGVKVFKPLERSQRARLRGLCATRVTEARCSCEPIGCGRSTISTSSSTTWRTLTTTSSLLFCRAARHGWVVGLFVIDFETPAHLCTVCNGSMATGQEARERQAALAAIVQHREAVLQYRVGCFDSSYPRPRSDNRLIDHDGAAARHAPIMAVPG